MNGEENAVVLGILGQPTRFEVIRLLLKHEPEGLSAGDVARALSTAQNTLSSHLAKLSEAGLVRSEKRSRFKFYRADRERLSAILTAVSNDLLGAEPKSRSRKT